VSLSHSSSSIILLLVWEEPLRNSGVVGADLGRFWVKKKGHGRLQGGDEDGGLLSGMSEASPVGYGPL
jgi:hypothetical protein